MRAFFAFATRAAQALFIMLAHCLFFTVKKLCIAQLALLFILHLSLTHLLKNLRQYKKRDYFRNSFFVIF